MLWRTRLEQRVAAKMGAAARARVVVLMAVVARGRVVAAIHYHRRLLRHRLLHRRRLHYCRRLHYHRRLHHHRRLHQATAVVARVVIDKRIEAVCRDTRCFEEHVAFGGRWWQRQWRSQGRCSYVASRGGMNELFEIELGCKAKVARRRALALCGRRLPKILFNANEVAV